MLFNRRGDKDAAVAASDIPLTKSEIIISSANDLAQHVSFDRSLANEINLSIALMAHICPLETTSGSKRFNLLTSKRHQHSEELNATLSLLSEKGYKLADNSPNQFIVGNDTLLLSINKGELTGNHAERIRSVYQDDSKKGYIKSFESIIKFGAENNSSDIHINIFLDQEESEVRYHIDSLYVAPPQFILPTATLANIASTAYQLGQGGSEAQLSFNIEQQCRIDINLPGVGRYMLRWASMAADRGPQITMRLINLENRKKRTLDELGYLPSQVSMFKRAMKSEGGAILLAGVVNSGKSTTIVSLLSEVPSTRKVVTVEDPREDILHATNFHQNTVSRPLDSDKNPFTPKIRTIKRSALNDVFIGEIRDEQTGELLQDMIESGTNAYSTVHAKNCVGIPARLASPTIGISKEVISTPGNLKLLVYQALIATNCPHCKISAIQYQQDATDPDHWHEYFDRIRRLYSINLTNVYMRNEEGCPHCRRDGLPALNGFKGRTVVAEMVEPDDQFLEFVQDSKPIDLMRYVESLRASPFDDADMTGKSAMECAVYKMSKGLVDPRQVEIKFLSFATVEIQRQNRIRLKK